MTGDPTNDGHTSNHPSKSKRIKTLSCQRCRAKKSKCDNSLPCASCVREGVECVRITSDKRKERYKNDYTEKLQSRVDTLEKTLASVRHIIDGARTPSISTFGSPVDSLTTDDLALNMRGVSHNSTNNESPRNSQNMSVYGPTSVFEHHLVDGVRNETHIEEILRLQKDPHVVQSIKLFFRWQYPDLYSFVVREAFLIEFFTPIARPVYCSTELVLAICALGSRMSTDPLLSEKSMQYYSEAKALVLRRMDKAEISTMQAFLLLAFFDISNGNNTSGWMLSGCGMRMGFDLGFQLDPKIWFLKSSGTLSELSKSIRSRIYWGCYFADHFISLVLGRPSILKLADSTVPETQTLPDYDWITEYTYLSPGADPKDKRNIIDISAPLRQLVRLLNLCSDILNDIFTKGGDETFNLSEKVKKVQHYNQTIILWRKNLPEELQWSRISLSIHGDNPTKMFIRYFYYIFLLCLNRPFLDAASGGAASEMESPSLAICMEVIDDIQVGVSRFQSVHGLGRLSILLVYCCILSVSVLLIANVNKPVDVDCKKRLEFHLTALHQCSSIWLLAQKALGLVRNQLEQLFHVQSEIVGDVVELHVPESPSNPYAPVEGNATPMKQEDQAQGFSGDLTPFDNFDVFGGPPLLMNADMINQEYGTLFSDFLIKIDLQTQAHP